MLERWDRFQDCELEDIRWRRFGTSLDFHLSRPPRWGGAVVVLRAEVVREFRLNNHLPEELIREMSRLDQGYSEIELIRLVDIEEGSPWADHRSLAIEGLGTYGQIRRFLLVCSTLEVIS